ncbi:uncharacterized protein LOC129602686 [Paramacrobiotus metropolitanus]|uniref:uncharacterized protein LOC129602686 n=1 Tax=Paramacrobiotus metropolitanus TaxID=2943436 RepID=UPI0024458063|nr:uncharacterized protein LOC129602686 [Paramacrobiotus metropolitanus]
MEPLVVQGKHVFLLALGMLLFPEFVAATPTSSSEPFALFCNLEPFAPAAQQMQALADCITAIGTNFRRLADAMNGNNSSKLVSSPEVALPPSSPPANLTTTTVRPSPTTEPPAPIHRQRGATPPFAAASVHHQREMSWPRRFMMGQGQMAEQHLLFTIVLGTLVLLGVIFCLIVPFLEALEKRSVPGRIMMLTAAILGLLSGAWALDNIITALYE